MKSSVISSRKTPPSPSPVTPPRNSFALTGRSATLDPLHHAVRADLADVRLAAQVFAPHYAAPMAMQVIADTPILAAPSAAATTVAILAAGERFDVLEMTSAYCWGQSCASGLVGYVAGEMLAPPGEATA